MMHHVLRCRRFRASSFSRPTSKLGISVLGSMGSSKTGLLGAVCNRASLSHLLKSLLMRHLLFDRRRASSKPFLAVVGLVLWLAAPLMFGAADSSMSNRSFLFNLDPSQSYTFTVA